MGTLKAKNLFRDRQQQTEGEDDGPTLIDDLRLIINILSTYHLQQSTQYSFRTLSLLFHL